MLLLKWDACHVADKVIYNMHTNEICGFAQNAFDIDVLLIDLYYTINKGEQKNILDRCK